MCKEPTKPPPGATKPEPPPAPPRRAVIRVPIPCSRCVREFDELVTLCGLWLCPSCAAYLQERGLRA